MSGWFHGVAGASACAGVFVDMSTVSLLQPDAHVTSNKNYKN